MDVVVHQTPRKAARPAGLGRLGDQRQTGAAVVVGEEHRLAAVAALGDMKRHLGDDDAGGWGYAEQGSVGWGMGDGATWYYVHGTAVPELWDIVSPQLLHHLHLRILFRNRHLFHLFGSTSRSLCVHRCIFCRT